MLHPQSGHTAGRQSSAGYGKFTGQDRWSNHYATSPTQTQWSMELRQLTVEAISALQYQTSLTNEIPAQMKAISVPTRQLISL